MKANVGGDNTNYERVIRREGFVALPMEGIKPDRPLHDLQYLGTVSVGCQSEAGS